MKYSIKDDKDSTIHSLGSETKRRRDRLEKMGRKFSQLEGKVIDGSVGSYEDGIMKVRTLKESLMQGTSIEVKRKRRQLNRRMNNILKSKKFTSSNTSTSASSSLSEHNYSVSFDSVTIREFPVIPGDNPSVTDGPPMAFDWSHEDEYLYHINEYEILRQDDRRVPSQMRVPRSVRYQLLLDHGNSQSDIKKSIKSVNQIRSQRRQTMTEMENNHASANPFRLFNSGNKKRADQLDKKYLSLLDQYSQEAEKSFERKLREISKVIDDEDTCDSTSGGSLRSTTNAEDTIRTDKDTKIRTDNLCLITEKKGEKRVRFSEVNSLNSMSSMSETSGDGDEWLDKCSQQCSQQWYVPPFITCTKPKFEPSRST